MGDRLQIVHEKEHNRFSIAFPNGGRSFFFTTFFFFLCSYLHTELAVLEYSKIAPDKWDYCHTFVPVSKRGRGVADKLATEAMDYIANNNMKAKLTCSYMSQTWLASHPEYKKYVV